MNNYHVNMKGRKQGRKNGFRLQMKIDLPCAYPGCEVPKAKEDPPAPAVRKGRRVRPVPRGLRDRRERFLR
ncbi:GXT repeat-containing collagen-like protein [Bacillus velezensis]|nr:GXT repeat-containing collagen-like protein [Bacillus velezensis]